MPLTDKFWEFVENILSDLFIERTVGKKNIRDALAEMGTQKFQEVFGIKEGGKGYEDEILFTFALEGLTAEEVRELESFMKFLESLGKIDLKFSKYCEALILATAHIVQAKKRERKETNKTNPSISTDISGTDYDTSSAVKFIKDLLKRKNHEDKVEFLRLRRVFETFAPEKTTAPAKKFLGELAAGAREFWKEFQESQRENLKDMVKKSEDALRRSEEYRKRRGR